MVCPVSFSECKPHQKCDAYLYNQSRDRKKRYFSGLQFLRIVSHTVEATECGKYGLFIFGLLNAHHVSYTPRFRFRYLNDCSLESSP
jgi:hypothetical protein